MVHRKYQLVYTLTTNIQPPRRTNASLPATSLVKGVQPKAGLAHATVEVIGAPTTGPNAAGPVCSMG